MVVPSPMVNPLGTLSIKPIEMAQGLETIKGKTIGLLDNRKSLSDLVINIIKDYLAGLGAKDFVYKLKTDITTPSSPQFIEELTKTDAVIGAVAD